MLGLKKFAAIGFDGTSLNLVALKKGLRGFETLHWAALENFRQQDPLSLLPAVEDFFQRARVDKSQTVVALPRRSVVLRMLQFPQAVQKNLPNIIEYQVENFEPIDREGLAYAHQWVNRRGADGKLDVLLAMARRDEVGRVQKLLGELGVRARAIVCESLGLARLIQLNEAVAARENNFLVRADENEFELIAVFSGKIQSAKRFEFQDVRSRSELMALELDRARAELRVDENHVHNVFVTGPNAEAALVELRSQASHLPLHLLRTPGLIQSRMSQAEFQRFASTLGTAINAMTKEGLATNLMDHGEVVSQPRWVWVPTGALCGIALLLLGASAVRPYVQQERFLKDLNAEIARLQPQVRQVERLEAESDEWQKKASVLEGLQGKDVRNLEALRELSEILPETTWINEFTFRGDTVEISGFSENATALVPLLEQSTVFQDVALASGITRNQQGKEMFRIRAKFKF